MRISYWSSDVCSSDLLDGSFVVAGVLLFGSPHLAAQALYLRRSDRNVVLEAAHDAPDLILDLRLQLRHLLTHGLPGRVSGVEGSRQLRSEEHTSELQSLMRISYAVFCLKKNNTNKSNNQ